MKVLSWLIITFMKRKRILAPSKADRKIIVCVVYAKPSMPTKILEEKLRLLLDQLPKNEPIVLTGDFNENLLVGNKSSLEVALNKLGFYQYITHPTTDYGSLLDHMYYNDISANILTDVVDCYFSDHDSVFMSVKIANSTNESNHKI